MTSDQGGPSAPDVTLNSLTERLGIFLDFEKRELHKSIESLARFAAGDLLDVGCGDKPYEELFAGRVSSYTGIEYSASYTGSFNEAAGKADLTYDGEHLPFPDGSFDTVLCTQVLEHVRAPASLTEEMARVLRPGGRLIATVPFCYRIHDTRDFWRFTAGGLEVMVSSAGLIPETIEERGTFWESIGQAINWYLLIKAGRLKSVAQESGSLGYLPPSGETPRYVLLGLLVPVAFVLTLLVRALDRLSPENSMVLGYSVVAVKG